VLNQLSIDVEEYFHPTEVRASVTEGQWSALPSRIEQQMDSVLGLLGDRGIKATFFVLGWVASRHPRVVRTIVDAGHDVGCHSYLHRLVYDLTPAEFREDTIRAVRAIEDAGGVTPRCYRAPSYSITAKSMWALETLVQCGFTRDSSVYPIAHDRYGISGFERHAHTVQTPSGPIEEIPIATVRLPNGSIAPIGGGGYLRLLPYRYTAAGIRRLNQAEGKSACIYFHPWELDPEQPRLASGAIARLRTYSGISSMRRKLERLTSEFAFAPLGAVEPARTATISGCSVSAAAPPSGTSSGL
jgi:polysaccharide deacetylase family protein (PEP-CTERM system associated)